MPETWRAQRDRNDEGKVIFNQQSAEKPMEQTSASTGERREFLEAFLQYNRAFHAHHLSGTLKYSQDAYRTTVDIGTDVKNGIAKRHMGLAGRVSYNWNYRYFADFNFGYNGSENFADGHRFGFFPCVFSRLEYSRRNVYKETSEMDEYVQVTLFLWQSG